MRATVAFKHHFGVDEIAPGELIKECNEIAFMAVCVNVVLWRSVFVLRPTLRVLSRAMQRNPKNASE
jgi:hypothetical protein